MKILLAVDGSRHSQEAINEVRRRPWPPGSSIRVLSVVQLYPPPVTEFALAADVTLEQLNQERTSDAEALTAHIAEVVKTPLLETEAIVRTGDPRSAVVDEAAEWGADLIVVGSHGRTGLNRWLLGSVAKSVVDHAPCSVEVVRRRQGESDPSAS